MTCERTTAAMPHHRVTDSPGADVLTATYAAAFRLPKHPDPADLTAAHEAGLLAVWRAAYVPNSGEIGEKR
jgi:hypothetical protein